MFIRLVSISLVSLVTATSLFAQSPFQFREAALLEEKMFHSGENYSATNSSIVGREASTPANRMIADADDPDVYRSSRWVSLLAETDSIRRAGNFALAEKQYLDLLANIRKAQGRNSQEAALLLDHIGEFYLELREFDKAYPEFAEAVLIRRDILKGLGQDPRQKWSGQDQQQHTIVLSQQDNLVKLLIEMGRIDFAKGDFHQADAELLEATQIGNVVLRLNLSLDAVYFASLSLEKQKKWSEAEALWQEALKVREKLVQGDIFWDSLKEQAAFYARRGDFHTAAAIATRIQTAPKQLAPSGVITSSLDARMGLRVDTQRWQMLYKPVSTRAMEEIIAIDEWMSPGDTRAAEQFAKPAFTRTTLEENDLFTSGSASQEARYLSFLGSRAFLQMSVLLDGSPTPEQIEKAHETLQPIKGRYLDTLAQITSLAESARDNPHVSFSAFNSPVLMLDGLAAERAKLSHTFVAAALDGKPFSDVAFASAEQSEEAAAQGLAYAERYESGLRAAYDPSPDVPAGAAFVDITAWERTDRRAPATLHREYGAFIFRKDKPPAFVHLAPAADIDADIAALENVVVGPHVRGVRANTANQTNSTAETASRLKRLYQEVIGPMMPALTGVHDLVVVPDGKLTLAPLQSFVDPQGKYVLERFTVTYLSSVRALTGAPDLNPHNEPERDKTRPPVIVANPDFNALLPNSQATQAPPNRLQFEDLPGAAQEASDVQRALHISADRVLTGRTAREEQLRSIGGPEILHFATHSVPSIEWKIPTAAYDLFEYPGTLATENPMLQSVIALSGANRPQVGPDDGLLTGIEIASLRLAGTKLVVLSTCEAGQGTPVDGQGVLGLRGAFLVAGAEGVVMSLWPVDDKAGRLFMQYFYSHLESGPAQAVRQAQLDLVAKTPYKEPRYWAGYSYSGHPSNSFKRKEQAANSAESLVNPTCYQITTQADKDVPGAVYRNTYRVTIGGSVRKSAQTAERAVYTLSPPASDLEMSYAKSDSNGSFQADPGSDKASVHEFSLSLTIERTTSYSSLSIREFIPEGDQRYKPQTIRQFTFKGAPGVFPNFDIPAALPALSSYTETPFNPGDMSKSSEKITAVGACAAK